MASYVPCRKNDANGYVFYVSLISQADIKIFQASPTLAAGDAKIALDDAAPGNLGTLPVFDADFTKRVKVTLSQAETNADNLTIILSDAAGAEWCDLTVNIQTAARQIDDLAWPTTTGKSIDVSDTGEVGLDFNNIKDATGAHTLTNITVPTVTTTATATNAGTVTGNVNGNVGGNVTGSVGSVAGNVTGSVGSVAGNVTGTVASVVGAVGSVTGNVTGSVGSVAGNVTGTVASVVGAVGSVSGNVVGTVASVVGAVGSVTGNVTGSVGSVAGNVTGSVASVTALGAQAKLDVNAEVDTALTDLDLDHLIQVSAGIEEPTDGAYLDQIMNKAAGQTFDDTTDSLEAIRDTAPLGTAMRGTDGAALAASWTAALATALGSYTAVLATALGNYTAARAGYLDNINQVGLLQVTAARAALLDEITALRLAELDPLNLPADIAAIVADVWDEAIALHLGVGSTGATLNNASAPTAAQVADAVLDEPTSAHTTDGSLGERVQTTEEKQRFDLK